MYALLGLLLVAAVCAQSSSEDTPAVVYSPGRPPAVPLAVRSPYTSVWSSTRENGTLNTNGVMFWTGQPVGWEGIVTVDGISYEWMGTNLAGLPALYNFKSATPLSVSYDSQYSNFTFEAGPVILTARFFSPVTPSDLCRTSVPLSYLEVSYQSSDNSTHDVKLYTDVDSAWNNFGAANTVTYTMLVDSAEYEPNATVTEMSMFTWEYYPEQEYDFSELNDFPQWGDMTLSTQPGPATNFSFQSGSAINTRYNYITKNYLTNEIGGGDGLIFSYLHSFDQSSSGSALYTVGVIQQPVIKLLTSEGLQSLSPWWSSNQCYGSSIGNLIAAHYADFEAVQGMAAQFEAKLKADVDEYYAAENVNLSSTLSHTPPFVNATDQLVEGNYQTGTDQFGEEYIFNPSSGYGYLNAVNKSGIAIPDVPEDQSYYAIVALSTRQIMAAYVLTIPPVFTCGNSSDIYSSSEPFMFQKEISSNGNMNTVDVLYPAMPFFLYANPNMLRYAMNPLYLNQESGFYPRMYSMHDLGSHFPNATGHINGDDEQMPVEESGNMLLMTYAYYKFTGDAKYVRDHYTKLFQWAQFLIEYTLIPSDQLSTDDFLGTLENQTNLAIKGIVGLQAMASMATVVGNPIDATNFSTISSSYYAAWEDLAIDPTGTHTVLAYQWRSSWGLLYNTYPDKLLNLGIIPQRIYDMQSTWYASISQAFGLPLDNRHSLTKSDWELWTAATASPHTRRLVVNALAYWLNNTSTDKPFTDLYETIATGGYPLSSTTFIARPVAGGHFALLAMLRSGQDSTTGTAPGGFERNSTVPLAPEETQLLPVAPEPRPDKAPTVTVMVGTWSTSRSVEVSSTLAVAAAVAG